MSDELKLQTFQGIKWSIIEKFGVQIIKFIAGIILARLLSPEEFGLIGIVMVLFFMAQVFIESGLGKAYIQKKDATDVDANSIFYFNLLISLIIYSSLWLFSPYIANFYNAPILIDLIRVMGFVIIINAFSIIQNADVVKNIDFKRRTKLMLLSSIFSSILAIYLALNDFGVWSLVYLYLSYSLLLTLGLWFTSKWKPKLIFSIKSLKKMLSFGIWVLFAGLVRTIFDNIYVLIIGKFFSITQAGFYTRSKQFQQLIAQQFSQSIANVSFPVFSKLQDSKNDLYKSAKLFLMLTLACIVPILITLIVMAEPFILILLTKKWLPMVPFLQLLCIVGILYPIHLVNIQILIAKGETKLNFKLEIIKGVIRMINILIMYKYGIIFIIIGEVFVSLISLLINTYYTKKIIGYSFIKQMLDIKYILISGLIAGFLGHLLSYFFINLWLLLILGSFVTIVSYSILLWMLDNNLFQDIRLIFKNKI